MPSLTLDTSPQPQRGRSPSNSGSNSRSTSPGRAPPFSPITPTLSAARLAAYSNNDVLQDPVHTYAYSQDTQVSIPQPPLICIDFESNPDTLALKSAIAVLLTQSKTATNDIAMLERTKARAMADPETFLRALDSGSIKSRGDSLFHPISIDKEDVGAGEDEEPKIPRSKDDVGNMSWEPLPIPQTVVRTPSINWAQYGIVGESLDKIHADQLARPVEGTPARVNSDGQVVFNGGDWNRRQADLGIAAPYTPGRDKIEKVITRKGSKR